MKRIMAIVLAAGILTTTVPGRASAGDREWATAGKIMTGILGVTILGNALASQPAPAYAPPPRVRYQEPEQVWVRGHYEVRTERQWVPGHWEIARGGHDCDDEWGGRRARRVWVSGHYRTEDVRTWIPGHWEDRG